MARASIRTRPGVVLLAFKLETPSAVQRQIERAVSGRVASLIGPPVKPVGGRTTRTRLTPLELVVDARSVPTVLARLRRNPAVAYAEPDYLLHGDAIPPNDADFSLQWASYNTGQAVPFQQAEESEEKLGAAESGTPGADDGALRAWKALAAEGKSIGSRSIVIGEVDTGVDYEHPDLAQNVWSNPGGVGGCPAGTHGYDVLAESCNPMDQDTTYGGHGTNVAGIMGASGDNGIGVAGMNWQTTILPVKWLDTASYGETSALVAALQWLLAAKQAGVHVRVVNDSATFYGAASSEALKTEIERLGAEGILFVTAAGNSGEDDEVPGAQRYPCNYDLPNEICVTASNHDDQLPPWANYGPHVVQLAAPGVSIYSTLREDRYGYMSGGSMASPQVAGAAALVLSADPTLSAAALKADILDNTDALASLAGKVETGGRLDVCDAVPGCDSPAPLTPPTIGGTAAVGRSLACSTGAWKGTAPLVYAYQWLRDGTPIAGAAAATYVPVSGDPGHSLACRVTASSPFGERATAESGAVLVPATAAAVPKSGVHAAHARLALVMGGHRLTVHGRNVIVRLRCKGAVRCTGMLQIVVRRDRRSRRARGAISAHDARARPRRRLKRRGVMVIGSARFSIAAGHVRRVVVHLNRAGIALLRGKRGRLAAQLDVIGPSSGTTASLRWPVLLIAKRARRGGR